MPQTEKKSLPLIVRIIICVLAAVIFYIFGYSLYILTRVQQFVATSTTQKIAVTPPVNLPNLSNQTNILLLGSDNDQKFTGNPLTQTMMIVHIDYTKKEIDMFSIPRDLWVKMPNLNTYGKIDQAAEYNGIPSAIAVVEQTFGIPINHYAWVGLYGFIKSIDAIGGVNIDAVHPVLDNAYPTDIGSNNPYGVQRLDIQAGMQHMDGQEALQYVRSRHEDLIGDFGRTQRQRQLLLTLKQTLLQSKSSLLDVPQIFDSLKGQIKTDIDPLIAMQLATFYITNKSTIQQKQYTLTPGEYSQVGNSTDGQSIVIADPNTSSQLVGKIFGAKAQEITLQSLLNEKGIQP